VIAFRQIERRHIEAFKLWLVGRENQRGEPLKKSTIHLRLSILRVVFERLIEWDHPDTPARNPILWTDLPKLDEPLPKFLDDEQAAKFMAAAVRLDPQRRLIVEMLARTGLRVTEFCELTHDAIVKLNETNWLRVPVGKLHTDRYVPLHPSLIELHRDWLDWNGPNTTGRLISNKGRPLNRTSVSRIVKRCANIAAICHLHPPPTPTHARDTVDQQRHEPRSRVRNAGHRSMRMTIVYARIADRTIAEEYLAAADKVDQLFTTHLTTSPA
jgi:integrase